MSASPPATQQMVADPLVDATMTELEARITSKPNPDLPIYQEQQGSSSPWPSELEPVAQLARQCCCAAPAERLKAEALLDHLDDVTA